MKKTTLTISGASAYAEALLRDARVSGRAILAIQPEPDPRRGGSQADTPASRKPARPRQVQADLEGTQESPEDSRPDAEGQEELDPSRQQVPEKETRDHLDTEPTRDTASWTEHASINWNPGSFASTKAALIEAETSLGGTINEAIVFIDPSNKGKRLPELSLGQIEAATTSWITGYAQLLRELARRFTEHGSGLILVVLLPGDRGPLEAMAAGAMEALACSLAAQTGEAYRLLALRDESGQPDLLARYIIKILDEQPRDSSKLLRHGGRITLFGK